MNRDSLRSIAQDTLCKVKQGYYDIHGKRIYLKPFESGKLYTLENIDAIDLANASVYENPKILLLCEKTVYTIFRYNNEKMGVLNFASAYKPGGGFINGAIAQEESLAYCSNLYDTIKDNEYYTLNKAADTKMYTDNMIISDVHFFRNSDYDYVLQPKEITVLTSAAVNMKEIIKRNESITLKNRMRKLVKIFAREGCKSIVLGAFGCGVFGNNPEDVAGYWIDLLIDEEYEKYFETIIFSVYDGKAEKGSKGNYQVFRDVMEDRSVL